MYLMHCHLFVGMAWYVVFRGRIPGVYDSWGLCSEQVLGYGGAACRSYVSRSEAEPTYTTFLEQ
jgi:ribonuclease HI